MRKQVCFLFLLYVLLLAGFSNSQTLNHSCSDAALRGLTKLYLDTSDDLESREHIIDVIGKEFPNIRIVEQRKEAEIIITYSHRIKRRDQDGVKEKRVEAKIEAKTTEGEYRNVSTYTATSTCGVNDKKEARRFARGFINLYEEANR